LQEFGPQNFTWHCYGNIDRKLLGIIFVSRDIVYSPSILDHTSEGDKATENEELS